MKERVWCVLRFVEAKKANAVRLLFYTKCWSRPMVKKRISLWLQSSDADTQNLPFLWAEIEVWYSAILISVLIYLRSQYYQFLCDKCFAANLTKSFVTFQTGSDY